MQEAAPPEGWEGWEGSGPVCSLALGHPASSWRAHACCWGLHPTASTIRCPAQSLTSLFPETSHTGIRRTLSQLCAGLKSEAETTVLVKHLPQTFSRLISPHVPARIAFLTAPGLKFPQKSVVGFFLMEPPGGQALSCAHQCVPFSSGNTAVTVETTLFPSLALFFLGMFIVQLLNILE